MASTTTKNTTARKGVKKPSDRQPKKTTKKASAPRSPAPSALSAPSDISAFKARAAGELLALPSGLAVQAKRVQLEELIAQGNVPNPLMGIVSEALEKGQKADISKMVGVEEGEVDLDLVKEMFTMVNEVVVSTIVSPKVLPVPEDESDRDDDLLYVDELDPIDKMFIFQWCIGGTDDLERFREEFGSDMASLAEIQGSRAAS